jgi:two-component system cell cycle sensor histidine kinase/response regulator CckA
MSTPLRILFLLGQPEEVQRLEDELRRAGFQLAGHRVLTRDDFLSALDAPSDVILADLDLPGFDAPSALQLLRQRGLDIPLILIANSDGEDRAVAALRAGAADYLLRDRLARLGAAVQRALEQRRQNEERQAQGRLLEQRARLEEQHRQAQKMEAVGRLAGKVAHDFNNCLTVITGYTELALAQLPSEHPVGAFLLEVRKAGERATSLSRQLQEFSRKEAVAPVVLDLNELLRRMEQTVRRLIGEGIDLALDLAPAPSPVKADPGQLEQAILSLAGNAREAMPAGGSLSLHTRPVDLTGAAALGFPDLPSGPYLRLSVRDTGGGMDEATRARLFEPFFTTRGPDKGAGLGLAMVYSIVKQSGGHIEVESELGKGSTFHIYLPRVEGAAPDTKPPPGLLKVPGGTETVLLVEDEDRVRALARLALASSGYTVLEARDGQEALDICQREQGPIHLVVTDIVMPKMSGRELADRLAALRPGIKVLFLSGYPEDAVLRQGVTQGKGRAFLQKPFTPAVLARRVREVLDG